jgi:hypothetical protein
MRGTCASISSAVWTFLRKNYLEKPPIQAHTLSKIFQVQSVHIQCNRKSKVSLKGYNIQPKSGYMEGLPVETATRDWNCQIPPMKSKRAVVPMLQLVLRSRPLLEKLLLRNSTAYSIKLSLHVLFRFTVSIFSQITISKCTSM